MSNIDEKAKNNFTIEMRIFGYWFPPYKEYIPHRIKVLKLALKDLERIKEEYGKDFENQRCFILWLLCVLCLGMPLTCV